MHVDCDRCQVRGDACSECVVTLLLDAPVQGVEWDENERQALGMLADTGLLPPLRLVTPVSVRGIFQAG